MLILSPALESWLLAAQYFVLSFGVIIMAWFAGGIFSGLLLTRSLLEPQPWQRFVPGMGIFLFINRILLGLALFSFIGALWGCAGSFILVPVIASVIACVIAGAVAGRYFGESQLVGLARDWLYIARIWSESGTSQRFACSLLLFALCAMMINAFIGSLVPDFNHDPMWYHLPVPQQWVFDQEFFAYSSVMPSVYPLAVESIYAMMMLAGGNSVLCSLLMGWSGTFLFVLMPAACSASLNNAAFEGRGWGVVGVSLIWVPLIAVHSYVAPLQPKNDLLGLAWGFSGAMVIWLPLLAANRPAAPAWWMVGGILLGTACNAKPNHLPISGAVILVSGLWCIMNARDVSRLQVIKNLVLCTLAILLTMAPWIFRAIHSHGIPFYPIGYSLFTLNPEFKPLVASYEGINGNAGLSLQAWKDSFLHFPTRLYEAMINSEKTYFIYIIVTVALLAGKAPSPWRWYGAMLLLFSSLVIGMKGNTEVFRFFLPAICLATLVLGWFLVQLASKFSIPQNLMVFGCLGVAAWYIWISHQGRMAGYATYSWEYRPVLGHRDVENYAHHAEKGWTYLDFAELRRSIDKDDRVFLLGCTYPFYLHRDTLWNDEAVRKGGVEERFRAMGPEEAETFLKDEKIDVVLVLAGASTEPEGAAIGRFRESGVLKSEPLSAKMQARGWRLYRVLVN